MEKIIELAFSKDGAAATVISLLVGIVLFFVKKYISETKSSFDDLKESNKVVQEDFKKATDINKEELKKTIEKIQEEVMGARIEKLELHEGILKLETAKEQMLIYRNELMKNMLELNGKFKDVEASLIKHEKAIASTYKILKKVMEDMPKK